MQNTTNSRNHLIGLYLFKNHTIKTALFHLFIYCKIMTTITLEVNPEIAAAYQAVSSAEREQITKIVTLLLQNPAESDLAFLRRIMDDISDKAEANGLTSEILESILNDP
jgi:hypothetical protein